MDIRNTTNSKREEKKSYQSLCFGVYNIPPSVVIQMKLIEAFFNFLFNFLYGMLMMTA
jgi:hypothetical protein